MQRLSLTTQTHYAELLEQTLALDASRSLANLRGSFVTRTVKGQLYHYYHYRDIAGAVRQIYLGPDSETLRRFIDQTKETKSVATADIRRIEELCAALRATGAIATPAPQAKVIEALADAGIFRRGMVLVGTQAFLVLGNVLGVRWQEAVGTHDIDFAYHGEIDIAVVDPGTAQVPGVLEQLKMGFLPVPKLNPKHPSTSFKMRGKELRVDFLLPVRGRMREKPVYLPQLATAAEPIRFLDYLIETTQQAVIVANRGILVNIPTPARFALHKLIVASDANRLAAKATKDINQAAQLFQVLLEDRRGEITAAWRDLEQRGRAWSGRVQRGLLRLQRVNTDLGRQLTEALR